MKETGVVRRIDELGRIVIPKEIRKKMKIREGDALDIFIEGDCILLHKYSAIKDIIAVLKCLIDSISKIYNLSIVITDMNSISSATKGIHQQGALHPELYKIIEGKEQVLIANSTLNVTDALKLEGFMIVRPIINYGELLGSIIFLAQTDFTKEKKEALMFLHQFIISYTEA